MPIEQDGLLYRINGRIGLEHLLFTGPSNSNVTLPRGVQFAQRYGGVLPSMREAAALRIEADGQYGSDKYQLTRTVAVYFIQDGRFYVAIDDDPHPERNIITARAAECYIAHHEHVYWNLPKADQHVQQILRRAERDSRILGVPEHHTDSYSTSTGPDGVSQFGSNPVAQAILGDMAEPYATFLGRRRHRFGEIILRTPLFIARDGVTEEIVDVRPVGLRKMDEVITRLDVNYSFGNEGCARGVQDAAEFISR